MDADEARKLGLIIQNDQAEAAKLFGPRAGIVVGALGRMMGTTGPGDPGSVSIVTELAYAKTIEAIRTSPEGSRQLGENLLAVSLGTDPGATVANTFAVAAGRFSHLHAHFGDNVEAHAGLVSALATYSASVGMLPPRTFR
jgi:hypothetical protein